jgi:hypothetical protein
MQFFTFALFALAKSQRLTELLASNPDLSATWALVQSLNLTELLDNASFKLSLFVPTNDAVDALRTKSPDQYAAFFGNASKTATLLMCNNNLYI